MAKFYYSRTVFIQDPPALMTATCFVLFCTACQLGLVSVGKETVGILQGTAGILGSHTVP